MRDSDFRLLFACLGLLFLVPTTPAPAQIPVELLEVECAEGRGVGIFRWKDTLVVSSIQAQKLYRRDAVGDLVCEALLNPGNLSVDGDSLYAISEVAVNLYEGGEWVEYSTHPWVPNGNWFQFGEKRGSRIMFASNEPALYFSSDYGQTWGKHFVAEAEYINTMVLNAHGFFVGMDNGVLVLHPQSGDSIAFFPTSESVWSMAVAGDRLYVANRFLGVKIYDLNTLKLERNWKPIGYDPFMVQVVDGELYFAGPFSLHRVETQSLATVEEWTWETLVNPLTVASYEGDIYISSLEGLYRFASQPSTVGIDDETRGDSLELE